MEEDGEGGREPDDNVMLLVICVIMIVVVVFLAANQDKPGCEIYEVDQRGNVCLSD